MSPVAARRPVSRATTSPLRGSSTTRTPGTCAATARVSSVLALLTTRISSGRPRLREKGMEAGRKVPRFVMGADDDADPQRHACADRCAIHAVVYPRASSTNVEGRRDDAVAGRNSRVKSGVRIAMLNDRRRQPLELQRGSRVGSCNRNKRMYQARPPRSSQ